MEYGEPPGPNCIWVYRRKRGRGGLAVGEGKLEKYGPWITIKLTENIKNDLTLCKMIEDVYARVEKKQYIFITCETRISLTTLFAACYLKRIFGIGIDEALIHLKNADNNRRGVTPFKLNKRELNQISRYRPPMKIVITGDRESSSSYKPIISRVLKELPYGSTVIHGDCRGIDKTADDIAMKLNLNVKRFPISQEEWKIIGYSAGPIRNKKMLEENPDEVHAFHPDIQFSKGTKNMIIQAYARGINTYIYDLKSKVEFNGSLDDL